MSCGVIHRLCLSNKADFAVAGNKDRSELTRASVRRGVRTAFAVVSCGGVSCGSASVAMSTVRRTRTTVQLIMVRRGLSYQSGFSRSAVSSGGEKPVRPGRLRSMAWGTMRAEVAWRGLDGRPRIAEGPAAALIDKSDAPHRFFRGWRGEWRCRRRG